ncbi:MAG: DUF6377 domain-containing protein [Alloprevotella sp.]
MKLPPLIAIFMVSTALSAQSLKISPAIEKQLEELDEIVENKPLYHAEREKQAAQLKQQAKSAQGQRRVNILKEIFDLYSHFQVDSAQVYLDLLEAMPEVKQDPALVALTQIARAEIHSVAGLYADAEQALNSVDPTLITPERQDLRLYYYRMRRTLCGWMVQYIQFEKVKQHWEQKVCRFRDSLICIDPDSITCNVVRADKANAEGQPEKTLNLLLPLVKQMDSNLPDPYVCFTLAEAYNALGKREETLSYLIQTAKADLQKGTTEYMALPWLAQLLFEAGQVERAYTYLLCSMEDANFCNASLRSVEVSNVFPIIDRQYKQTVREQHRRERVLLYVTAGLLGVLALIVVLLNRQMRKLHQLRKQQAETNQSLEEANKAMQQTMEKLHQTNETLQQTYAALRLTDKMKEEYIARYLNQCRSYIEAMEKNRKICLRMVKERQIDELYKVLKSEQHIRDEQDKFLTDFDTSFLTLFPNFIKQFNELLKPEERIVPKHENQLNTELRIFALIRLGVKDTQQIAHFLNFSLATVYNYRSKIRNRALGNPADFEARVAEL